MNKAVKYARNGILIGGAGFGLANLFNQLIVREQGKAFNWKEFFTSILKGAAIGGSIGLGAGVVKDYLNAQEEPINTDAVLFTMLNKVRLNPEDRNYRILLQKSDWLIEIIKNKFADDLKKPPYRFGSTEKGTALKEKFDIDICVSFKPSTFSSTTEMYFSLLETLNKYNNTNGIIKIRDQKKSIGVFFLVNGIEQKIDILPHKITKTKGNSTSGYLYVNNKGLFAKPSRTKTDIQLLNSIKLSETQKKILIVLKDWKNKKQIPLSSHLLQYLVLDAYFANKNHIPRNFTSKIIMVFNYIKDNIENVVLSSIENTNNILTNISDNEKLAISIACKDIVEEYQYQPNSIINSLK